jgi:hypothetical protein
VLVPEVPALVLVAEIPARRAVRLMTEAELQALVTEACQHFGLHHYHAHDSRRSTPGFPDSVIVGARVLYRELKTDTGKLTPAQRAWGSRLEAAGQDWQVWRPAEWSSGLILRQLGALKLGEPARAAAGSALRVSAALSCP